MESAATPHVVNDDYPVCDFIAATESANDL
jgi:hypothetical protein